MKKLFLMPCLICVFVVSSIAASKAAKRSKAGQIFFVRYSYAQQEETAIYSIHPNGKNIKKVSKFTGANPAFDPIAPRILFEASEVDIKNLQGGTYFMSACFPSLWIRDIDGRNLKFISDVTSFSPTFSQNGKLIAFCQGYADPHGPEHYSNLLLKKRGDARLLPLTSGSDDVVSDPAFSPDNKAILFAWGKNVRNLDIAFEHREKRDIYKLILSDKRTTQLTKNSTGDDTHPSYDPTGKRILFVHSHYAADSGALVDSQIFVMDADGSHPKQLTSLGKQNKSPSFSPDGKQIVFVSNRDGNDEIYVMNADGSHQTRLTYDLKSDLYPSWR